MADVFFRVDSSNLLGMGHLMRCLTFAQALKKNEMNPIFICRELPGMRIDIILRYGFSFHILPSNIHNDHYLPVGWIHDAKESLDIMLTFKPVMLVIDHYDIDIKWEKAILEKLPSCFILVIDDLANRTHFSSGLLDQTINRTPEEYQHLLPVNSHIWLGSSYTLMRDEFLQKPIPRNIPMLKEPWRIVVSLGGTDPENNSQEVLDTLSELPPNIKIEIIVILGGSAPHLESINNWCKKNGHRLMVDCDEMAAQLDWAHLAIGAGGISAGERCARGLPSLLLVMSDNQEIVSKSLSENGAAINLGRSYPFPAEKLKQSLIAILNNNEAYSLMASKCCNIFDGLGAQRLATELIEIIKSQHIQLYPAQNNDSMLIWKWQCEPDIRKYFRNTSKPTWVEHSTWFTQALSSQNITQFIITCENQSVGVFRLNKKNHNLAEVSILICTAHQRKGISEKVISIIQNSNPTLNLQADVHPDNIASQNLFIKTGFIKKTSSHFLYVAKNQEKEL